MTDAIVLRMTGYAGTWVDEYVGTWESLLQAACAQQPLMNRASQVADHREKEERADRAQQKPLTGRWEKAGMGRVCQRGLVLESLERVASDRQEPSRGGNAIKIKSRLGLQCFTSSLCSQSRPENRNRNGNRHRHRYKEGGTEQAHVLRMLARHRQTRRGHTTPHHTMPCHTTRRALVTGPVWPFIVCM